MTNFTEKKLRPFRLIGSVKSDIISIYQRFTNFREISKIFLSTLRITGIIAHIGEQMKNFSSRSQNIFVIFTSHRQSNI